MQVTIKNVDIENVVKGRSRYSKAKVDYVYNGENRQQTMMSFANPDVFKKVQELVGQVVEVEVGKNDAGYSEWRSIQVVAEAQPASGAPAASSPNATRYQPRDFETREERAARQVLIVKQSSLSAAVESLSPGAKGPLDEQAVLDRAQRYTDWVLSNNKDEQPSEDIPF